MSHNPYGMWHGDIPREPPMLGGFLEALEPEIRRIRDEMDAYWSENGHPRTVTWRGPVPWLPEGQILWVDRRQGPDECGGEWVAAAWQSVCAF